MSTDPDPLVSPAPPSDAGSSASGSAPKRRRGRRGGSDNMLPQRGRRSLPERMLVRLIATCGIVGIGVAVGAILVSSNEQGWMVGLIVSIVSVVLAALLWSSRVL